MTTTPSPRVAVVVGNPKPVTPTYPPSHPLSKIKR